MKRISFLRAILSLILCLALCSCSGGGESADTPSAESSSKADKVSGDKADQTVYERVVVKHTSPAKLRMLVISDTHNQNDTLAKAIDATWRYAQTQEYKGLDAVVVVGDMTNYGKPEEFDDFKNAYDRAVSATGQDIKLIACMGNHEFGNKSNTDEINQSYIDRFEKTVGHSATDVIEVKGYKFITLSPKNHSGDYSGSSSWLREQLKSDDGQKPIFLLQHYQLGNTVYQSGAGQNTSLIFQSVTGRKNLVDLSGHSHAPITHLLSAYQQKNGFSAYNCGSLSNTAAFGDDIQGSGYYQSQQFSIFEVYDDNVTDVKLYDLVTDALLDTTYQLGESVNNTKEFLQKASDSPKFSEDAKATVASVGPTAVGITFDQATDDDGIEKYRIDVLDGSDKSVANAVITSYYFKTDRPSTLTQAVTGLKEETKYTATVTAVDFYGNESEPIKVSTFITDRYPSGLSAVIEGNLSSNKAKWTGKTDCIDADKGFYISSQGTGHSLTYGETVNLGTKWMASVDYYRATYNLTDQIKSYSAMQIGPLTLGIRRGSQCDYVCLAYNYNGENPSASVFEAAGVIEQAELTSCLDAVNNYTVVYDNGAVKVYRDGALALSVTADKLKTKMGSAPVFSASKIALRLNDLWVVDKMGATFNNLTVKK